MSKFIVKNTPTVEEALIIKPAELGGAREWLTDVDSREHYTQMGLEEEFVQCDTEKLARGVVRGLYFNRKDSFSRIIGVTSGRILCVVVDLRPESKGYGAANSIELSAENETLLYVPAYFAYGFLTLEANSVVVCNSSRENDPSELSGIIYDDEILSINWQYERYQIDWHRLNVLQRDKKFPSFRSYNPNALWINRPKKSKYALSRERVIVPR